MTRKCPEPAMATRQSQTRRRICTAFTRCTFAKGFENVSIAQVVAEAGVARSTFYEHFADKEDVLRACLARIFKPIAASGFIDIDAEELNRALSHLWLNKRLADGIFTGRAGTILHRMQVDLVEACYRRKTDSASSQARPVAIGIAGFQISYVEAWLRGRFPATPDIFAKSLAHGSRALAHGLPPPSDQSN